MYTEKYFLEGNRLAPKGAGKWLCRTSAGGKRHTLTLTAPTKRAAAKIAAAFGNGKIEEAQAAHTPRLADIFEIYAQLANGNTSGISLKPETAHKNMRELKRILVLNGLDESARITELRTRLVERWRLAVYAANGLDWRKPNPDKNTSLNSSWRQAKSVFSERARIEYEKRGIKLPPNLYEFIATPDLTPTKKLGFSAIDADTDALMKSLAESSLDGATGEDLPPPLVAVMYEMARYCGMTVREIYHFRPDWIINTAHGAYIDIRERGEFTTKRGTKNRKIPVSKTRVARWLNVWKASDGFGEYAQLTERGGTYEQACEWLNKYLPDREKKLHELRKMACSEMLLKTGNIFLASKFIGNSVATTVKYYADLIDGLEPL